MKQLFYAPKRTENQAFLHEAEIRHVAQVLRKQVGDVIEVVDGQGNWYRGTLTELSKRTGVVDIAEERRDFGAPAVDLHLAVAPTKNSNRFEWLLEKATEIGVGAITPVRCRRSERKNLRTDRLEKILLAAMKQSGRAYLPILHPLTDLDEFLGKNASEACYIAHLAEPPHPMLSQVYNNQPAPVVLIGPEGDFHPDEVAAARTQGYQPVSIGPSRLRTETAGIVACQMVQSTRW